MSAMRLPSLPRAGSAGGEAGRVSVATLITDNTATRDAARRYITELGWAPAPIHPIINGRCGCHRPRCDDTGKHPATTGWQRTIPSLAAVDGSWPDRLGPRGILIPCGPRVGWVLDVDPRHGGDRKLRELQAQHGTLPRTTTSRTGSGGWHLIFRWVDGIRNGANIAASGNEQTGLDVRGEGGFFVAPPSQHANGRPYRWIIGPEEQPPAEAPGWLFELVRTDRRGRLVEGGSGGWDESPLIPAGKRHDALVRFGGHLRSLGLREETVVKCGLAFIKYETRDDDPARPIDWKKAELDLRDICRRYPPFPNRSA
jgi:putative DNA primase/helicase